MIVLTYRGKPARVDPHLAFDCPPVGLRWRRGVEPVPKMARRDEEADYWVVPPAVAEALRFDARFRRLFGRSAPGSPDGHLTPSPPMASLSPRPASLARLRAWALAYLGRSRINGPWVQHQQQHGRTEGSRDVGARDRLGRRVPAAVEVPRRTPHHWHLPRGDSPYGRHASNKATAKSPSRPRGSASSGNPRSRAPTGRTPGSRPRAAERPARCRRRSPAAPLGADRALVARMTARRRPGARAWCGVSRCASSPCPSGSWRRRQGHHDARTCEHSLRFAPGFPVPLGFARAGAGQAHLGRPPLGLRARQPRVVLQDRRPHGHNKPTVRRRRP